MKHNGRVKRATEKFHGFKKESEKSLKEGEGARETKQSKQAWLEPTGVTGFSKTFQSLRNRRPCEAETSGL